MTVTILRIEVPKGPEIAATANRVLKTDEFAGHTVEHLHAMIAAAHFGITNPVYYRQRSYRLNLPPTPPGVILRESVPTKVTRYWIDIVFASPAEAVEFRLKRGDEFVFLKDDE